MNTLSSIFGYGIDYVKGFKFPGLSTLLPFWPFPKGEPFEDETPDPAEEEAVVETTEEKDTGEEEDTDTGTKKAAKKPGNNYFFNTDDVNPIVMLMINIILDLLYYIFIFILASIIANDLIYTHWGVRLFTFSFVLYLCYKITAIVYPISIYYIINALYNIYTNYRDKPLDPELLKLWHPKPLFPRRYAFLPLMTSRSGGVLDLLNPFSYFPLGDDPKEPKYANYTYDAAKYKEDLNILIPGFVGFKGQFFGTLLKKFNIYFSELNKPFIKYLGAGSDTETQQANNNALNAIKGQIKGSIVTAIGLEESAKYIEKTLKP